MYYFSYHLFSMCFYLRYGTDVFFLVFLCVVSLIALTAVMPAR